MVSVWSLFFHNANPLQVSSLQLFFISEVPCSKKGLLTTIVKGFIKALLQKEIPKEIRLYQGMKKPPLSLHRGLVSRVLRWIPHDTKGILQVFPVFLFPRCFSEAWTNWKTRVATAAFSGFLGHIKKHRENWGIMILSSNVLSILTGN